MRRAQEERRVVEELDLAAARTCPSRDVPMTEALLRKIESLRIDPAR
jgi:hypothetical protein